jgi:tetratricopeptide (TPR) repeat protein
LIRNRWIAKVEKKTLAEFLKQASDFFDVGEVVKAGQIWQAILKRDSSIAEAKSGLLKVRAALSKGEGSIAKPPAQPKAAAPQAADGSVERFLQEGCSLYDSGALLGALDAWEKVLAIDPGHYLALSYTRGVRKELGLPINDDSSVPQNTDSLPETPVAPSQQPQGEPIVQDVAHSVHQEKIVSLVERGSQLYKVGNLGSAIETWESVLALDPDNVLAKGYLTTARIDMKDRSVDNAAPFPTAEVGPSHTDALFISLDQSNPRAIMPSDGQQFQKSGGLQQSEPFERSSQIDVPIGSGPPFATIRPVAGIKKNIATQMPSLITSKHEPKRQGPAFSKEIKKLPLLSRLASPLSFIITFGIILLLAAGVFWFISAKKDALLRATQAAIKEGAIKNAHQSIKIINLSLTTEELKSQARAALGNNPLRAYMLVQEVIALDPTDSSAAKLLDQAQQTMTTMPRAGTDADFNRLMAGANLDGAAALLEARLRQNPNNIRIREDLARLCLLQARSHIKQDNWNGARSRLLMGAALFPKDPTWQARLKLLEHLQSIPREEQQRWTELLG